MADLNKDWINEQIKYARENLDAAEGFISSAVSALQEAITDLGIYIDDARNEQQDLDDDEYEKEDDRITQLEFLLENWQDKYDELESLDYQIDEID